MGRSRFGSLKCSGKDSDGHAQADERLMRIEHSLALLSGALGLSSDDNASHIDPMPRQSPRTAFSIVPVSNGIIAESADGSTRFYKSCSLVTQCFETKQIFTAADEVATSESAVGNMSKRSCSLAGSSYSVVEKLQNKLIDDHINHQEPSTDSFDLPPRELVDRSQTIFFSQLHYQRPILQESSFQDQVRAAYSQTAKPPCLAAIVCLRHVIVYVLRLQRGQDSQTIKPPSQEGSTWIENLEEFHKAAKAIVRSPRSLKPQFIDVQALAIAVSFPVVFADVWPHINNICRSRLSPLSTMEVQKTSKQRYMKHASSRSVLDFTRKHLHLGNPPIERRDYGCFGTYISWTNQTC